MRSIVAAAVLAACSLRSRTAFADLPIPQVEGVTSTGFAYVGTVNPTTVPMSALPPIDLAPVVVTQTNGPGGAKDVEIHGGTLDVVHFGPGHHCHDRAGCDRDHHDACLRDRWLSPRRRSSRRGV